MDDRPIGIFDSGVGGLTSINAFSEVLPFESILYFGDTARAPYGSKSPDTVRSFSKETAQFLINAGAKILVAACNTSSATALDYLRESFPGMIVQGIIEPCAQQIAAECAEEDRIGIIATQVTVNSRAYEAEIAKHNDKLQVFSEACPDFVPLIESGAFESGTMEQSIKHHVGRLVDECGINVLVLGCTHYPIIRDSIERLFPGLRIIDPSLALANKTKALLQEEDMLASDWPGWRKFYASDLSPRFLNVIERLGIKGDYSLERHRL